ncbi:MAG: enoyl-CoA hydratase-related protein [Micropepsaceae bacterium]
MNYANYERIRIARAGRVLTLTLSNPSKMNAVDGRMHEELSRIFYDVQDDDSVDIVVLQGDGNAFSAGGDIEWMRDAAQGKIQGPSTVEAKKIIFGLLDLEKPLIAKVRGPAIGLGCTVALFCDVIFAADTARFADPHVKVGVVAGDGGAVIWPQLIGYAKAKEYLMTGDAIIASEAERMGLINHSVPESDLDKRVDAFASRLANGAPQAIKYTKVAVNLRLKEIAHTILDASLAYEMLTFATSDHREAVASFLEKRKPVFTGK